MVRLAGAYDQVLLAAWGEVVVRAIPDRACVGLAVQWCLHQPQDRDALLVPRPARGIPSVASVHPPLVAVPLENRTQVVCVAVRCAKVP